MIGQESQGCNHSGGMKMIRNMIKIDEERCNGCGACVSACHEGAIRMVDGKAKIDATLCVGCGVCEQLCKFDALG